MTEHTPERATLELGKAFWNLLCLLLKPLQNKKVQQLIGVIIATVFLLPSYIIDSLIRTGYGIRRFPLVCLAVASALLFVLAHFMQSLAGDMIFLLAVVFTCKWIAEVIWYLLRRRANSNEHSCHPGVSDHPIDEHSAIRACCCICLSCHRPHLHHNNDWMGSGLALRGWRRWDDCSETTCCKPRCGRRTAAPRQRR